MGFTKGSRIAARQRAAKRSRSATRAAIASLVSAFLLLAAASKADAETRLALIVANEAYSEDVGRLATPRSDAALIADALTSQGFEVVEILQDAATRGWILQSVERFADRLADGGDDAVGFFYFSGHGLARPNGGGNHLLPIGVTSVDGDAFWSDTLRIDEISSLLTRRAPASEHILVFDGARADLRNDGAARGFERPAAPAGALIVFSSDIGVLAPGAADGAWTGPFAQRLAAELRNAEGLNAVDLIAAVRARFERDGLDQRPLAVDALRRPVLFGQAPADEAERDRARRDETRAGDVCDPASLPARFAAIDQTNPALLRAFARVCPESYEAQLALALAEQLEAGAGGSEGEAQVTPPETAASSSESVAPPPNGSQEQGASGQAREAPAPETEATTVDGEETVGTDGGGQSETTRAQTSPETTTSPLDGATVYLTSDPSQLEPLSVFRECDRCPEMVVLPSGQYAMGDNSRPERTVAVEIQSFAIARTETTVGDYAAFVEATGHANERRLCRTFEFGDLGTRENRDWSNPGFEQTDAHPVTCVSWRDAQAYVAWLNTQVGGELYRLPSEAEWEYFARAGSTTHFFFGNNEDAGCAYMNVADRTAFSNSVRRGFIFSANIGCRDGFTFTAPVAQFQANDFLIFDVHGNIFEFLADCYGGRVTDDVRRGAPRGARRSSCGRSARGGSWYSVELSSRAHERSHAPPEETRTNSFGFRLARTISR